MIEAEAVCAEAREVAEEEGAGGVEQLAPAAALAHEGLALREQERLERANDLRRARPRPPGVGGEECGPESAQRLLTVLSVRIQGAHAKFWGDDY